MIFLLYKVVGERRRTSKLAEIDERNDLEFELHMESQDFMNSIDKEIVVLEGLLQVETQKSECSFEYLSIIQKLSSLYHQRWEYNSADEDSAFHAEQLYQQQLLLLRNHDDLRQYSQVIVNYCNFCEMKLDRTIVVDRKSLIGIIRSNYDIALTIMTRLFGSNDVKVAKILLQMAAFDSKVGEYFMANMRCCHSMEIFQRLGPSFEHTAKLVENTLKIIVQNNCQSLKNEEMFAEANVVQEQIRGEVKVCAIISGQVDISSDCQSKPSHQNFHSGYAAIFPYFSRDKGFRLCWCFDSPTVEVKYPCQVHSAASGIWTIVRAIMSKTSFSRMLSMDDDDIPASTTHRLYFIDLLELSLHADSNDSMHCHLSDKGERILTLRMKDSDQMHDWLDASQQTCTIQT